MALTRIQNDVCSISDRDARNEDIYDYQLSNIGNYRRGYVLNDQIYGTTQRSLEQDVDLESKLQGIGRVNNNCNFYGAGPQADILASAPATQQLCVGNALAPQYTRGTRTARHENIYESGRAKPMDYWFYSPPGGIDFPSFGLYRITGYVDTREIAKAEASVANKQMLLARGSKTW